MFVYLPNRSTFHFMSIRIFFMSIAFAAFTFHFVHAQQEPVEIMAKDTFGIMGTESQIDIKVNNFTNIIAAQASVNWDPTLLAFVGISNFGIKDLDETDFGTTQVADGHLRFAWTPDDAMAVTVEDETILFSVTFEVISADQASASISFTDITNNPPFEMEFANDANEVLTVNAADGNTELFLEASEVVNIISLSNTSCDKKMSNGSLQADVRGQTASFTFYWYLGNEMQANPDFTGSLIEELDGGDYTLRVLDNNDKVFMDKKSATVLNEPAGVPDVIGELVNQPQTSCTNDPASQTGMIEINVNDQQPDDTYIISWWKGDVETGTELPTFSNMYQASRLEAGNYEVVVENISSSCKAYFETSVAEEPLELNIVLSGNNNLNCGAAGSGSVTVEITNVAVLSPRYFWFEENDMIDTTNALHKGTTYPNLAGGRYKAYVIDLASRCEDDGIIAIEDAPVLPTPEVTQKDDTLFSNYSDSNWYFGETDLGISAPFIIPQDAGWYTVVVTNEYQCSGTSLPFNFNITGLEQIDNQISIYPNPFHDFVRVSNPEENIRFIRILDQKGAMVHEIFDVKQRFIDLHLSDSPDGIYLMQIQTGDMVITRKVIKNLTN